MIHAPFNGFVRTNANTDGPLDHYIVNFSPNGQGTDVHGAGGVQSLYLFHYPKPGYPLRIDDTYQKTLANLRQWAMLPTDDPGLLCTLGFTDGDQCMTGTINGIVPFIMQNPNPGVPISVAAGKKVLNYNSATDFDYYTELVHATYCGDDAPSPPGGNDIGTYMYLTTDSVGESGGVHAVPAHARQLRESGRPERLLVAAAVNPFARRSP